MAVARIMAAGLRWLVDEGVCAPLLRRDRRLGRRRVGRIRFDGWRWRPVGCGVGGTSVGGAGTGCAGVDVDSSEAGTSVGAPGVGTAAVAHRWRVGVVAIVAAVIAAESRSLSLGASISTMASTAAVPVGQTGISASWWRHANPAPREAATGRAAMSSDVAAVLARCARALPASPGLIASAAPARSRDHA